MTQTRHGLALAGALLCAAPASASTLDALTMMRSFTNITLGDLHASAETEGTVFVGGDYYGGANVNPDGLAPITLGGNTGVFFVGGDVKGNATVSNGNAVVAGAVTGNVQMNGGSLITGVVDVMAQEMSEAMTTLSADLATLADTGGTANLSDQNNLGFTSVADENGFAVFNVSSSWLASGTFHGIQAAEGVTTIINVSGTNVTIGANANQTLTDVVFNFFEAQQIQLNVAFNYTVLAPLAAVTQYGGGVNGTMVSGSLVQGAEIRPTNFTGDLPTLSGEVPLPAGVLLLPAALAGLGLMRRRAA